MKQLLHLVFVFINLVANSCTNSNAKPMNSFANWTNSTTKSNKLYCKRDVVNCKGDKFNCKNLYQPIADDRLISLVPYQDQAKSCFLPMCLSLASQPVFFLLSFGQGMSFFPDQMSKKRLARLLSTIFTRK